jgi:UPF0755 protein
MTESSPRTATRGSGRSAHLRRNLTITGILLVALALLIGGAVQLVLPMFTVDETVTDYPGPGSGDVEVVVVDAAPEAIGTTLVQADVVATVDAFVDAYGENPDATGILPGTYSLARQMTAADAVSALLDPANRIDRTLTIPPGWRASQILAKVSEVMGVPLAEVDAAADEVELPEDAGGHIEGWLFADSYTIAPDDDVQQVLQRMVDRTIEVLNDHEVGRGDRQIVLTQASIVEAEVSDAEDRGKVARVMQNRLDGCADVGEYLQMNSTVAYGLGKSVTDLTLADLADDSTPYNTYVFEGLPPTPINSPSVESIEAVLSPPEGDWCYFVTVDLETGETRFTDDPAEHEQNKADYRAWLTQWREEQSAAAEDPTTDGEG